MLALLRICVIYDCLFPHTVGGAERWYRNLAERLAEIRVLKQRIAALTTTVEHFIRDNNALRQSLAQPGAPISFRLTSIWSMGVLPTRSPMPSAAACT